MKHRKSIILTVIALSAVAMSTFVYAGETAESGDESAYVTAESSLDEELLIIGEKPNDDAVIVNDLKSGTTESAKDAEGTLSVQSSEKADEEETRVYRIRWKNLTGRGISGVQIKNIYAGAYPDNLLQEERVFLNEETAELFYDVSDEEENAEYNIRITFEDGDIKDMTSFPFDDMSEAELRIDDELLHAVYVSLSSGEEKDTIGREKALRQEAERAAEEAEDDGWDDDDTYQENHTTWENTGGVDECIGEDALLW